MIRFCACVIMTMGAFSLNGAIGQETAGASLRENGIGPGQTSSEAEQQHTAANISGAQQPPPGGNPLWGIPISSLSATRERPVFTASRRAPVLPVAAPAVAVAPAPAPPPAAPERPLLTLVGTAIGKPQNVAVILDQTTKNLVRLHVGEAASGWVLRSVDSRTTTVEKNSQTVTLALPAPGSVPAGPLAPLASGISREF